MSRIGKKPVAMPSGVSANVEGQTLTVKGPKGTLSMQLLDDLVKYEIAEGEIRVTPLVDAQRNRAAWGMQRTNVQNLVTGVTEGFSKVLEITGVGYRAQAQGTNLKLQLGYSHDVNFAVPEGVDVKTPGQHHGRDQRHRQAEGRPGRRRNPPLAQAGALQGQGHQISRRVYLPQRRQEEVAMAKLSLFDRRRRRVRTALRARAAGKPRLSVHRSGKHIYAQLIDDAAGKTIVAASTLDKEIKGKAKATREGAAEVGKTLAERAKKAGVSAVVFDRGGFLFHGRVKALADAAREGGLEF